MYLACHVAGRLKLTSQMTTMGTGTSDLADLLSRAIQKLLWKIWVSFTSPRSGRRALEPSKMEGQPKAASRERSPRACGNDRAEQPVGESGGCQ